MSTPLILHVMSLVASVALVSLSPVCAKPYPKWLAIGNSITLHGPKEDIGWLGNPRGMAASEVSNDYVHLLEAKLQAEDPANVAELKIVGRIGKLSGGTIEQMHQLLDAMRAWNADLVTVQLGENDHFSEIGADGFEQRYRMVVDALLGADSKPEIVCTGVWAPGQPLDPADPTRYEAGSEPAVKDSIIEQICLEKGLRFVPVAAASAIPSNYGTGETDGVKWHPNNAGMQSYADFIFQAIYPN